MLTDVEPGLLVMSSSFSKWWGKKSDLIIQSIFFPVSTSHFLVWNIWNLHFPLRKKKGQQQHLFLPRLLAPLLFATVSVFKDCQSSSWSQLQMLSMPWDAICKVWRLESNEVSRCFPTNFFPILDFNSILKIAYHSENSLPGKARRDMVHTWL